MIVPDSISPFVGYHTFSGTLPDELLKTALGEDYLHQPPCHHLDRDHCTSVSTLSQVLGHAAAFLACFAQSQGEPQYAVQRLPQVIQQIHQCGSYWHTAEELAYGVQLGWQQHLPAPFVVRDLRHLLSEEALFFGLFEQMQEACHLPQRPPLVTVFAPSCLGQPPLRIELFSWVSPDAGPGETDDTRWDGLAAVAVRIHQPPHEPLLFPLSAQRVHQPLAVALRSDQLGQQRSPHWILPHLHIRSLDIGGLCYVTTCCLGWISNDAHGDVTAEPPSGHTAQRPCHPRSPADRLRRRPGRTRLATAPSYKEDHCL